jgi:ACR3 family arsenite efflux pump ArsB
MENKKLWFKAKTYGWGWTPCSWEGWVVVLLYIVVITIHSINIEKFTTSETDVIINFVIPLVINTIFLIIISYVKGEKPQWRFRKTF